MRSHDVNLLINKCRTIYAGFLI